MVDPRILYDHKAQRWVACALERDAGQVILAVSKTSSPTNFVTGWTNCFFPVKRPDLLTDFTTMGLDDNGVYVTVVHIGGSLSTNAGHTILAIKKPEIYSGLFVTNWLEIYTSNTPPVWTAVNFDDIVTNDYAWFVAKGPPDLSSNYQGGAIYYRRTQWNGTNVAWADTDWSALSNQVSNYRNYYDLDKPSTGGGINAPNLNGTPIQLHKVGSRLAITTIRNGYLWTCQAIGLSGTNGSYIGNETGTNVDRSGAQWLKLRVDAANGKLICDSHGRTFDRSSTTNAFYYYFPSLAVNCAGDMVMGFSGSCATNYIGAYYTWRLAGGATLDNPRLIRAGVTNYAVPDGRWGDYSATTLDPSDDWSFWTVQEYSAEVIQLEIDYHWGTVVSRIRPIP